MATLLESNIGYTVTAFVDKRPLQLGHEVGAPMTLASIRVRCGSCAALGREVQQLRESSEQRARQDHDQCVAMFQHMQALVRLNESLTRDCNRDEDESASKRCSIGRDVGEARARDEERQSQTHRLQTIIVQQAEEIEELRRRQRDAAADGRVRPAATRLIDSQRGEDVEEHGSLHLESDCEEEEEEEGTDSAETRRDCRSAARRHASELRQLPLTSLRAQLKGKDLQAQRLQQIIAKLESRCGQLVDRKRSMAQSFQQVARTQQARLKKYLAYIRQQTAEKKALERQLRELKQYVDVLEKKVVGNRRGMDPR
ncbi:hypothetical protein PHYPSEUDO_000763 [Phytophthora pseudosyringae]|uniref:Uncharacterized protein n=1 Tax=Phytophthora pseudosyringae TaxID=221518 RepID=A0A8T1WGM9_9STRA|nr:hypothetical protein PHYPSEUDO_000763 [Phytophthora pseudosyringae]